MNSLVNVTKNTSLMDNIKEFDIHGDVKGLLWIYKPHLKLGIEKFQLSYSDKITEMVKMNDEYDRVKEEFKQFIEEFSKQVMGIFKGISNKNEPSTIYPFLPIIPVKDVTKIKRPPYWPRYSDLTPEQRYCYINYLKNPYDPKADVGYVFLFLYGVERFLFTKKYKEAIKMILRLRDIHEDNNSLYTYTTKTLLFFSAKKNDINLYKQVSDSIDDKTRYIDINSLIYFKLALKIGLTPEEVYTYRSNFTESRTKYNYIRKYPERFIKELKNLFKQTFGVPYLDISLLFSAKEFEKLNFRNSNFTANWSINQSEIKSFDAFYYLENNTYHKTRFSKTIEAMTSSVCEIIKDQIANKKSNF